MIMTSHKKIKWTAENDVDSWVEKKLESLGLKKHIDYNTQKTMSDYMKESLKGYSKTNKKTGIGIPDLNIEKYRIPIIIEDKLYLKKLITETKKDGIKFDEKSIQNYAVNGALYYAQSRKISRSDCYRCSWR